MQFYSVLNRNLLCLILGELKSLSVRNKSNTGVSTSFIFIKIIKLQLKLHVCGN